MHIETLLNVNASRKKVMTSYIFMISGHLSKKFLFSPSQLMNKNVIDVFRYIFFYKILGITLIILILMHACNVEKKNEFPFLYKLINIVGQLSQEGANKWISRLLKINTIHSSFELSFYHICTVLTFDDTLYADWVMTNLSKQDLLHI